MDETIKALYEEEIKLKNERIALLEDELHADMEVFRQILGVALAVGFDTPIQARIDSIKAILDNPFQTKPLFK